MTKPINGTDIRWRQHGDPPEKTPPRAAVITYAKDIGLRPVHWLWEDRLPTGSLCLLAGREGIGKSLLAYTLAAELTRGRLPGCSDGTPQTVLAVATEDSWAHTIAPRLILADADLHRIARVEIELRDGAKLPPEVPVDLAELERVIHETDAAMVILDPLLSRLAGKLDSHKDADVRQALEPLVAMADRTGVVLLGLIHLNKGQGKDLLTSVMGSRAFVAVARACLFVMTDPNTPTIRMMGQPKNNLGKTELPTRTFTIEQGFAGDTPEGPVYSAKLAWGPDSLQSLADAFASAQDVNAGDTEAINEAADWLADYLEHHDRRVDSAQAKKDGARAGHALRTMHRARIKLQLVLTSIGFPRRTYWSLPTMPDVPIRSEHDIGAF